VAADCGPHQPWRALWRHDFGGDAGLAHSGAHKPDYADWFGLFRVPQFTSTDKASANFYENLHIYWPIC